MENRPKRIRRQQQSANRAISPHQLIAIRPLIAKYLEELCIDVYPSNWSGVEDHLDPKLLSSPENVLASVDFSDKSCPIFKPLVRAIQYSIIENMDFSKNRDFSHHFRPLIIDFAKNVSILIAGHHLNRLSNSALSRFMNKPKHAKDKDSTAQRMAALWFNIAHRPDATKLSRKDRLMLLDMFDRSDSILEGRLSEKVDRELVRKIKATTPSEMIPVATKPFQRSEGPQPFLQPAQRALKPHELN